MTMKMIRMSANEFGRLCDEDIKRDLKKSKEEYEKYKKEKEIKMKVYAVCFNGKIKSDLIFSTRELARKYLKTKFDELRSQTFQTSFHSESADGFSYYYGWTETEGTWSIKEITVQ